MTFDTSIVVAVTVIFCGVIVSVQKWLITTLINLTREVAVLALQVGRLASDYSSEKDNREKLKTQIDKLNEKLSRNPCP